MKYTDLTAWQKAMDLVASVYEATRSFPKEETYGLQAQMRRSASSIPSNIAEGEGRSSPKEAHHFQSIARGSVLELQTQITMSHRLSFIDDSAAAQLQSLAAEVGRLVTGLVRHQKAKIAASDPNR